MKYIIWVCLFISTASYSQKLNKEDKKIVNNLKATIGFLANDKLEGRRTGTPGEKLAYEFLSKEFSKIGLIPKGENNSYIQAFEVNDGVEMDSSAQFFKVNNNFLTLNKDYFPLFVCSNFFLQGKNPTSFDQSKNRILFDLNGIIEENKNNPHFDIEDHIKTKAEEFSKTTNLAGIMFVYNSSGKDDDLKFDKKSRSAIPVIYISKEAKEKYFKNTSDKILLNIGLQFVDKKRTGHNIVGLIDNGAENTIILGAHYDHLGYGEDHNSLYAGPEKQIHHGADDNASGTAALLELGKLLKASPNKNYNYLLVSFSGEELGLFGSKYFTEHSPIDLSKVDYMINMDMVGRLNDSLHGLNIGGYGTSPSWGKLISATDSYFKIKFDSSGSGPSDHTSFYRKDIPVLFFFTGTHSDYHKPSDVADKINYTGELMVIKYIYNLITRTNQEPKLAFTKTREVSTGKSSFKVTLGIMPDYTFSGNGVRVDGVSDGKIAQKAGIKTGDIVEQLGDHKFSDVQTYMETLSKFKKGDATKVKVKRGNEELFFDIIF